jgi:hypothetical protein
MVQQNGTKEELIDWILNFMEVKDLNEMGHFGKKLQQMSREEVQAEVDEISLKEFGPY